MAIKFASKPPEITKPPIAVKHSRKGVGGRPKKDDAKELVSLRLSPAAVAYFRSSGDDWRARMQAILEQAARSAGL
jgi:uncharacterized protein (DUF4415 family)